MHISKIAALSALLLALFACERKPPSPPPPEPVSFDLPQIRERGTIRMLTRNNINCYFLYRGEQMGFEYALAKKFAEETDLDLEVIVPPSWKDLIPWLFEGKGDFIAAGTTITETRKDYVSFSIPYHHVQQMVVVREDHPPLTGPADLIGRTIHVRKGTSYQEYLQSLPETIRGDIQVAALEPEIETEEILQDVADGTYEITVADSNIAQIEQTFHGNLRLAFALTEEQPIAWAVRPNAPELLSAINAYHEKMSGSAFYNIQYRRYYQSKKRYRRFKGHWEQVKAEGRISPYDELLKRYAEEYGFDWLLLASQAYQESKFDPRAQSWAGAEGLMQIMPRLAPSLGLHDPFDPDQSVCAGGLYLLQLWKKFDSVAEPDRTAFALASYNTGPGHLNDARRLAAKLGHSADRWEGAVEEALLKLSSRKYYRHASHGYCRGKQAVNYVNQILERWATYKSFTEVREGEAGWDGTGEGTTPTA